MCNTITFYLTNRSYTDQESNFYAYQVVATIAAILGHGSNVIFNGLLLFATYSGKKNVVAAWIVFASLVLSCSPLPIIWAAYIGLQVLLKNLKTHLSCTFYGIYFIAHYWKEPIINGPFSLFSAKCNSRVYGGFLVPGMDIFSINNCIHLHYIHGV